MRLASLVVLGAFAMAANAQGCLRPEPPPGGFPVQLDLVVPVTYSDGYATFGSLLRPAAPPPACGWPLVVFIHPLGQMRAYDFARQQRIAAQGYAVWSFDVRGQGQAQLVNTQHPNAGSTLWGPVERCDLAEQLAFVAANGAWAGIVDGSRIAVAGSSQGAGLAWSAAALSGQQLVVPGRPAIQFPTIACAIPVGLVADPIQAWVRGGELFSSWFVEAISGSYTGTPFDPAFMAMARNAFLVQDPAGLAAALAAEGRGLAAQLATSTVPVLYQHAWLDVVDGPLSGLQCLEAHAGPHRALFGAVGHGVPANTGQVERLDVLTLRWLHRFLWNEANEVELESPFEVAQPPLDPVAYDDVSTRWNHAQEDSLTTPAASQRWFLHDDGELHAAAPLAMQSPGVIQQTIDPLASTFTPADYLNDPAVRAEAAVLAACPLQERVYTRTLAAAAELAASPTLHLQLAPDQASWMLAVQLTVLPPEPGASEMLLGQQTLASHGSVQGVVETHVVRLPPIAVRLPAGAQLRLRLRNLSLRSWPSAGLETAPRFHDFRVDVVHDALPGGCWLDLPLRDTRPRLVTATRWLELAAPAPIATTLRGGTERAGFPYFAAVGLSGQVPGASYLGDHVPIDGDWMVLWSAGSTQVPWFTGFLGFLDPNGETQLTFDLGSAAPLPQFLNGLQLTMISFVWDDQTAETGASSNAVDVQFR